MIKVAISVEKLSKEYRLGTINYGTLYKDIQSWWSYLRGKEDPNSLVNISGDCGSSLPTQNLQISSRFLALDNVSFDVQQGDVVGIIGRNGAGKSTLLKILSQVTSPSSGVVKLNGRVASLLEVGTGFHPELTGRENIFLNGAILGMGKAEIKCKFDEIVTFAEVEKFLDTPVKRYSSGMYVRLAFAVAAHLEPEILIVDEVLAVGDAEFQKKCLGKMEDVGKEGRTVLFVSHNMAAVQKMCNNCLLLNNGSIVQQGDTNSVVSTYLGSNTESSLWWERQIKSNSTTYFTKVYLCDEYEKPTNFVETSGSIRVLVEFVIDQTCKNLMLGVCLLDEFGGQIFATAPQDDGINVPHEIGNYTATVAFPKDILLPKSYGVKAILWDLHSGIFDCVDSIKLLPIETDSLANSTAGGRTGVLTMKCHWDLRS